VDEIKDMPPKGGKSANKRDTIVAMCGSDEECLPRAANRLTREIQ
jgi:hypothetical protein